jgi:diguanylate cyclase (GGDEF)-like protein
MNTFQSQGRDFLLSGKIKRKMSNSRWSKSWVVLLVPVLMFCCLCGDSQAGGSSQPVQLFADHGRYEVGPYLEILEDPRGLWTIEEVTSAPYSSLFSPVGSPSVNLGITRTTVWLRFAVSDDPRKGSGELTSAPWLLDIGWPIFDSAEYYLVRSDAEGDKASVERLAFNGIDPLVETRGAEDTGIVVRLPDLSPAGQQVYLKLQVDGVFFLYPVICTVKHYLEASTHRMLWFGIYFGILTALLLYNLFLYFCLRDCSYLWYVASIAAIGFYFFFINRLTYEYLVDFQLVDILRVSLGSLAVAMMALVLFARCFLETWCKAPLLDRLIQLFLWVMVGVFLLVPFASIAFLNHCFTVTGIMVWFLVMPAAVICWRRGYRPARFLILSWIFYGVSTVVYALTFQGILPFTGLSSHSLQIGSALEAILLSFALGDRINLLRLEREELSHSERRHKKMAITDVLTGLYNLRYFQAQINLELERVDRLGQKLTLMMLDVDYFKGFNDRFGHPEGDKVLTALGRILASCVREKDVPCRYGGEEFAIILPGGQNSTALEVYERINAELAGRRFGPEGQKTELVTLSIGVAEYNAGESAETLLSRADRALYEAKARGRNQIVIDGHEQEWALPGGAGKQEPDDHTLISPP